MSDNRPAVYLEGDTVIYRASALGHCLRELWAARCGMERKPIPQVIQQGMDEGTNLEPVILNLLYERHGFSFAYDQQGQQFQVELNLGAWNGKTLIVRGRVDEVGTGPNLNPPVNLPIDVKALTQDQISDIFDKARFPERYAWQQSVYAHGMGTDYFYMPIFNKGTWEIEPFSLIPMHPMKTREEIRDRVLQVEEAFANNTMPDDCPASFGCPYFYLHEQKLPDVIPEDAVALCKARIRLSEKIKIFEAARKTLDSKIKVKLSTEVAYYLDNYTITLYPNPRKFNTDAAKKLLTEAEVDWQNDPDFWIEGTGTQLRMTPRKEKDDTGS